MLADGKRTVKGGAPGASGPWFRERTIAHGAPLTRVPTATIGRRPDYPSALPTRFSMRLGPPSSIAARAVVQAPAAAGALRLPTKAPSPSLLPIVARS